MIRTILVLSSTIFLLACQTDTGPRPTTVSTSGDTRIAKKVFGYIDNASSHRPEAIGGYALGCQSGAIQLAETGQTWQAMRLSRNRNWAQPSTIDFLQDLSRFAETQNGWEGLYIGDLSQPRGGPMLTGHASHQSGLDADIWMLPPTRLNLTETERETLSSISMRRAYGAYTNEKWTPQHEAILKAAASDPRVARIFVFPGAKVEMCKNATGNREWLNKIRPWWGHHYHFHVRLHCPDGDHNCKEQAPPPPGDGCADAEAWVDRILNPPPPDPNPAPPRGPITMAQLPAECRSVALE